MKQPDNKHVTHHSNHHQPDVPAEIPVASSRSRQSSAQTEHPEQLTRPTSLTPSKNAKPTTAGRTSTHTSRTSTEPSNSPSTPKRRISKARLYKVRQTLSDRDMQILSSLQTWRLLQIKHLHRLHFVDHATIETALRVARRVLKRLEDLNLIRRLKRQIGGARAGSAGSIFCLTPLGHRLLGDRLKYWKEPSQLFGDHTLAIAELGSLAIAAARDTRIEITEVSTEPGVWRTYSSGIVQKHVKPDLLLRLASTDYEASWFIEVDLGTESLPTLKQRCQIYLDHHHSEEEQDRYGYYPSVMWAMNSQHRTEALTDVIASLGKHHSLAADLFHVTTIDRATDRLIESVR